MRHFTLISILLIAFYFYNCPAQNPVSDKELHLISSIQLPDVKGRIDHMAFDNRNQTIFVAALGNNTVEVIDLRSKKVIYSIKDLHEPQGLRYISENNTVFIANGENGECDIYNAHTYQKISSVKMPGGDADNVRYDGTLGKIYVGYGDGGISVLDAKTFKQLADIKLPGHPESFQLDPGSKKIYVNVPDAQLLATIDLEKNSVSGRWKIEIAQANFPMALDVINKRLFVGCRNPAKVLVINGETGATIDQIDIDNDTDDIFYDSSSNQIYVSCGGGYIDIIKLSRQDRYEVTARIETRSGARTSLFIPELDQLIVAAPARQGNEAMLLIFEKS